MKVRLRSRAPSIKARLISSYLVILFIGGLTTSIVGSWIVSTTIMAQARRMVDHSMAMARTIYQHQADDVRRTIAVAASGTTIASYLARSNIEDLRTYLESLRRQGDFDFLGLADATGRVLLRTTQPSSRGDDLSWLEPVRAALSGRAATGAILAPTTFLAAEDPALAERARIRLMPTPRSRPGPPGELDSGLVLMSAAPVRGFDHRPLAALYGGILLNRDPSIVDRVWELVFKGERYDGKDVGAVTLFQGDVRIATTVKTTAGQRAIGTRVSEEVHRAVLERGGVWRGRAFVVNDWYISAYEPLRDPAGRVIGMLYVGLLEKAYTSIRDRVILSFFGIASVGFLLIAGITYYIIGSITRPIGELVEATRKIAAGHFDQEVSVRASGELALLAESFNAMVASLRKMRSDLEEWGRTLEDKVRRRTEELVAMHDRIAQAERLASLGKLSAGVAHEINNPLGAVLALTALTLEDLDPNDPARENLEEVVRQAERCRNIVRGLLEFARQSEPHVEPLDLNRVLEETLALVARQSMFFNIAVVKELDPDLPRVMGDRSQLQQVFMNLLLNAVQAMEEKGTITLVSRKVDGFVEVSITDTGCGIPPDKLGRIFDPFFTTKPSGKGVGLGLSIAYGIVTKHGGDIRVESEVGRGSTFTVRLPVMQPPAASLAGGEAGSGVAN
ncbi:MAG: cache domain-containing protein [Bryobacterales bacterium]|nr:cache domain-containing protein [Bryobacteraceae bacterium]MDW8131411.1 cache domain-containing protein [Bryobacterales bacterium]